MSERNQQASSLDRSATRPPPTGQGPQRLFSNYALAFTLSYTLDFEEPDDCVLDPCTPYRAEHFYRRLPTLLTKQ